MLVNSCTPAQQAQELPVQDHGFSRLARPVHELDGSGEAGRGPTTAVAALRHEAFRRE
jgi:hypothetical protein